MYYAYCIDTVYLQPIDIDNSNLPNFTQQQQTLVAAIHSSLLVDGESVYTLVANPFLLLLARVILVKCSSKMITLQVNSFLSYIFLFIYL